MFDLTGRRVLVAGAAGGLGAAIVAALTGLGAPRRMGQPKGNRGNGGVADIPAAGFVTGQTFVADGGTLISDGS